MTFVSLHPAIIPGTRFGQDIPPFVRAIGAFLARLFRFGSTPAQSAERYLQVATGEVTVGAFYDQGKERDAPTLARDPAFAEQLWDALLLVGGNRAVASGSRVRGRVRGRRGPFSSPF